MTKEPNILRLIQEGRREEAMALLTQEFRLAAAAGPRSTKAALEAATQLFGGDLRSTAYFMSEKSAYLAGKTPKERSEESEEGLEEVLTMIAQLEAGVYL